MWLGGFLLFCGCLAWNDSDAEGCWIGVLFLYEVVNATFDVEPYAAAVAVRLAWRWKAPDFLSPACYSGFCVWLLAAPDAPATKTLRLQSHSVFKLPLRPLSAQYTPEKCTSEERTPANKCTRIQTHKTAPTNISVTFTRKNREKAFREKISRNNSDQMKQASQVRGKPYSEFRRAREVRLKSAGHSVHSHSTRNSPSQITPPN
ncbi:hypothetical protein Nepgr_033878 [Nepenthes gracilis]|uniref:Uncharacterized protein n=1 Tax=Nepenthes gracilis TaxID=150966 RepID=A0AAD3TMK4_NEPGR|nr:hypothetical protein Nepgr_033878 [Nepenthes gracilis]